MSNRSVLAAAPLVLFALAASHAQAAEPAAKPWKLQDAAGSERLKLNGSFRARYESLSGQPRTAFRSEDEVLLLRTTLAAQYTTGLLRFGAEVWDSRAYLDERDSAIGTTEVNALELVQAFAALDLSKPVTGIRSATLQAGRLTMNVGSRRLVAFNDYRNTTNAFTGLRALVKSDGGWNTDAFYTHPQLRLPDDGPGIHSNRIRLDDDSSHQVLYGALVTSPRRFGGGAIEGGLVGFHEEDSPARPTRNRSLRTWTARYFKDPAPGQWDLELEGALQQGETRTGLAASAAKRDVSASFYHLRFGYQWDGAWKPRLGAGYDYASGDGRGSRSHRYDTLYGMRKVDFAPSSLYNLVGRANITSPELRFEVAPGARLDAMLAWRALQLSSDVDSFSTIGIRDASGASGDHAGTQWVGRVRYWIIPSALRFELNAAYLDKGRFLREAPNARRNGDAGYVAASVQANF